MLHVKKKKVCVSLIEKQLEMEFAKKNNRRGSTVSICASVSNYLCVCMWGVYMCVYSQIHTHTHKYIWLSVL